MDAIVLQVLARADGLMRDAPGVVAVRRISEITEVRALRAAREALTADETRALVELRLKTTERLDGSASPAKSKRPDQKPGVLGSLLSRFSKSASTLSGGAGAMGSFDELARQAGVLTRLPAPVELIDAAEAWAISHLVADRVDTDLEVLRKPWLEASITPEA